MPVRLYPPDDPTVKVGIPREGELFDREDARRLVGQGLASRRPPVTRGSRRNASASSTTRNTPAKPAPEG